MLPALLVDPLIRYAQRTPYSHLTGYMNRFWVRQPAPGRAWAFRVHQTLRSDYGRHLHDHPWDNLSIVLRGGYWEVSEGHYQTIVEAGGFEPERKILVEDRFIHLHQTVTTMAGGLVSREDRKAFAAAGVKWRGPGAIVYRHKLVRHRLVIPACAESWSLFGMTVKGREWGYQTPAGWVHNVIYDGKITEETGVQVASPDTRAPLPELPLKVRME